MVDDPRARHHHGRVLSLRVYIREDDFLSNSNQIVSSDGTPDM